MNCKHCGSRLAKGNKFCIECGQPVSKGRRRDLWISLVAVLGVAITFLTLALTGVIPIFGGGSGSYNTAEELYKQVSESNYLEARDETGTVTGEIIIRGEIDDAQWDVGFASQYRNENVALATNALDEEVNLVVNKGNNGAVISIPIETVEPGMPYTIELAEDVCFIKDELKDARVITFIPDRQDIELIEYNDNVYELSEDETQVLADGTLRLSSNRNVQKGDILVVPATKLTGLTQDTAFRVESISPDGTIQTAEPAMEEIFKQLEISGTYAMNPDDFVLDEEAIEKQIRESGLLDNLIRTAYAGDINDKTIDIKVKMLPSENQMFKLRLIVTIDEACNYEGKKYDLEFSVDIAFKAEVDVNIVRFLVFDISCDSASSVEISANLIDDDEVFISDITDSLMSKEELKSLADEIRNEGFSTLDIGTISVPVAGPVCLYVDFGVFFENSISGNLDLASSVSYANKSGAVISLTKFKPYYTDKLAGGIDKVIGIVSVENKTGVKVSFGISIWRAVKVGLEFEGGCYFEANLAARFERDLEMADKFLGHIEVGFYGEMSLVAKINTLLKKVQYEQVLWDDKIPLLEVGNDRFVDSLMVGEATETLYINTDNKAALPEVLLIYYDIGEGQPVSEKALFDELIYDLPQGMKFSVDKNGSIEFSGDIPNEFEMTIGHEDTDEVIKLKCKKGTLGRLTTGDFIEFTIGEAVGSGGISPITLKYRGADGNVNEVYMENSSRIDAEVSGEREYDHEWLDEAYEDIVVSSDFDSDGIVEVIVYNEFWFNDLGIGHGDIDLWPTIYEVDVQNNSFVVATAENASYLNQYIRDMEGLISEYDISKNDSGFYDISSVKNISEDWEYELLVSHVRLHTTALLIKNGQFVPKDMYDGKFYHDVNDVGIQYVPIEIITTDVSGDFLIPGSDSRYISETDLEGFDAKTARIARNEVFARYGYTFTDAALQTYFNGQSWYHSDPNCNKGNPPQLNVYEEQNIQVIKGYEEWLNSNQGGMPILENALYDYPMVSLGHWDGDSINGQFIFNDKIQSGNGYTITCDIFEYTGGEEGEFKIVETKKFFIAKDVIVHCIRNAWTSKYDYYEQKTFEEFLNEGSSYGVWPDFYADIRGDQIVEMAEVYKP